MEATPESGAQQFDTDVDRHPNIYDALAVIQESGVLPNAQVDRLEYGALASGEVTLRWRELGAEEWEGTVFSEV